MKKQGDFSIGSSVWPGISKLVEECGEVQQVAGKLMGTGGETAHWDGSDLRVRLEEEIADLLAACRFVIAKNGLSREAIEQRSDGKLAQFIEWYCGAAAKEIWVNARRHRVTGPTVSYEDIVALSSRPRSTLYTVTFHRGPFGARQGSLAPGESIRVVDDMVFDAVVTDGA